MELTLQLDGHRAATAWSKFRAEAKVLSP